jgi:hypothetical protein
MKTYVALNHFNRTKFYNYENIIIIATTKNIVYYLFVQEIQLKQYFILYVIILFLFIINKLN